MTTYFTWLSDLPAEIDFMSGMLTLEPNLTLGEASFDTCEYARIKLDTDQLGALQDISSADIAIQHIINDDVCIVFEPVHDFYNGISGTATVVHRLDKEQMGDDTYRCPMCGHTEFKTYPTPVHRSGSSGPAAESADVEFNNDRTTECVKCSFIGELCAFNTLIWDNAEPPAETKTWPAGDGQGLEEM